MSSKRFTLKPDRSNYLEDSENDKLLSHIETFNCISISTAIIQLYISKKPDHCEWLKHSNGVVCLIKDYDRKSFFFRIYNLNANLLWEEEMSTNFLYHKVTNNFYYFPGFDRNIGFNFAFVDEAYKFQRAIIRAMNSISKLDLSLNNKNSQINYNNTNTNNNNNNHITINYNFKDKNKKDLKKKSIDKSLIGNPTGFVHVNHIGVNDNNQFNVLMNEQNEHMKMIIDVLKQMDIKPNKHSVEYADSFIKSNGGYQEYIKEYKKRKAPKPPITGSKSAPNFTQKPKIIVSQIDQKDTTTTNQNISHQNNFNTTPNSLKPPSRPPPKPPAYQPKTLEIKIDTDIKTSSPNLIESNIEFLSPIPSIPNNNYLTPEQQILNINLSNNKTDDKSSSVKSNNDNRNELLKSIENFKGGLRRVSLVKPTIETNTNESSKDVMTQLFKALGDMRLYLNQSTDEESSDDDSFC